MKTALLFALAVFGQTAQEPQTYANDALGLTFTCPKDWQITTNKKNETKALIPIEGTKESAVLEIYPTAFDAETSIWQLSQSTMAKQLRRQVVRQWEETVMQVPLLLTMTEYTNKQGSRREVTGLLYSKTPKKMMYKLTSAPQDFEKADYLWRNALQTLRTYNGANLTIEDGHGGNTTATVKNGPPPSTPGVVKIISGEKGNSEKVVKGTVVVKTKAAGRDLELRLPAGWLGEAKEDGTIVLRNPEIAGAAVVTVASTLDSDPPAKALFKASSVSLNDFTKVAKREEPPMATSKAGATLVRVWRSGSAASGELFTCDAVGLTGEYYWVLAYRTTDAGKAGAERKVIDALIDGMSVELPQ